MSTLEEIANCIGDGLRRNYYGMLQVMAADIPSMRYAWLRGIYIKEARTYHIVAPKCDGYCEQQVGFIDMYRGSNEQDHVDVFHWRTRVGVMNSKGQCLPLSDVKLHIYYREGQDPKVRRYDSRHYRWGLFPRKINLRDELPTEWFMNQKAPCEIRDLARVLK